MFAFLVLLELDELDVAEGNSKDGTISDWRVLGGFRNCRLEAGDLLDEFLDVFGLGLLSAGRNFLGRLEVHWGSSIHVLLYLVDFKEAVDGLTVLREGKRLS